MESHELLLEKISNLTEKVDTGFTGVHRRQDIANGRTAKIEGKVEVLEKTDIEISGKLNILDIKESAHIKATEKANSRLWDMLKIVAPYLINGITFLVIFWLIYR